MYVLDVTKSSSPLLSKVYIFWLTTYVPVESSPPLSAVRVEAGAGALTRGDRGSVRRILPHLWGVQEHPSVERKVGGSREVMEIGDAYVLCVQGGVYIICMYMSACVHDTVYNVRGNFHQEKIFTDIAY